MLALFAITTPIFLLIAVGYLAVWSNILTRTHIQGLSAFVLHFALPALIINAIARQPLGDIVNTDYLLAYGLGSLSVLAAMFVLMRFARSRPLGHSAIAALGAAASNSGFIGYPVAVLAIGDVAVIALALSMLVENFLIIPLGLALAEMSLHAGASLGAVLRKTVARLVRNPIVIAIVIGALISVLQPPLPGPLWTAIDMMARASAPAALFVIGGTLVGLKLDGLGSDIGWIVAAKLVAHPLAVLGAFMVFSDVDPALMAAGILLASVPMLSVYPIFGERFGLGGMCAAAMLGATVVAFLTVTMTIWLIVP